MLLLLVYFNFSKYKNVCFALRIFLILYFNQYLQKKIGGGAGDIKAYLLLLLVLYFLYKRKVYRNIKKYNLQFPFK